MARTAEETVRTGVEPEVAYNFGQDVAAKIMEDHDMDGDGWVLLGRQLDSTPAFGVLRALTYKFRVSTCVFRLCICRWVWAGLGAPQILPERRAHSVSGGRLQSA